jgi:hypothetical protein
LEELSLAEQLSQDVSIPIYSSGTALTLEEAVQIAAQKEANPEPETVTQNVKMGIHKGIRTYALATRTMLRVEYCYFNIPIADL